MHELMEKHLKLVIEANKKTNLTRIDSWEDGLLLHVEDSLAGVPEVNNAPPGRCVDLGSGAGFPGIPLAIETGRPTLLVDSVGKKVAALDEMIQELGLENVQAWHGRVEDLARQEARAFSVATARAVAKLSVLMELASPLLSQHGLLVCYKANIPPDELDHALSLQHTLAMELVSNRYLDLQGHNRRIVCFRKNGSPTVKLPRRTGMAQRKPL